MFAAGLVLLWLALQLIPSTTGTAGEPPVYSDESGSVAASKEALTTYEGPRLFSFGNVAALILLSGGAAFAYFVHKRSRGGGTVRSLIEPIGELGVGQGQQLRLVRCGGEVLLIGVTSNQITLLREFDPDTFDGPDADSADDAFDDEPEVASTAQRLRPAPVRSHFANVLRQYAGRYVNVQSNGTSC